MADTITRRHFMLEMHLDLSTVDTHALAALCGHLEVMGLAVSTLEREAAEDPEAVGRAYQCHMMCRRRQPPAVLRREPIPFDRWRESLVSGPDALLDLFFIATRGREFVGVCLLERVQGWPDTLRSGFTGTLPLWGGKGVAKALKAHALLHAARQGCRRVETSSLQVNQGMCAINRALGFQIVRRHLHAYEVPADPR